MSNELFNPVHFHDGKKDTHEVCEWIDAGIFSGDLLYVCDLPEFKEYLGRWQRAVDEHEKHAENEAKK